MSNYNGDATWWGGTTASDNITYTTSTDGSYSGNILSLTANTTWNFYNNYDVWPKGVQDPSTESKYAPKWHILLGYKSQINTMWD